MPWTIGVLALSLVGSARAGGGAGAEVAVVGVHVEGLDDAAEAEAAARLARALDDTGRLHAVPPDEVRHRLAGRESLVIEGAFQGAGRKALEEGRVLYQRAEFDDAKATLKDAVGLLTEALPASTDNRLLVDALLMQGLTSFSVGDNDDARAAFEQVVRIDPDRKLDPVNYSGPTVAVFDQVRSDVAALGVGAVQVDAEAGATVYVDGRSRGTAPLRVESLPAGPHAVLVVGEGGRRAFSQVQVTAGGAEQLAPTLVRGLLIPAGSTEAERARQTSQLYGALGTYADTGLVLLAGETGPGEVAVQFYEPRTGNFSKIFRASGTDPVTDLSDGVAGLAGMVDDSGSLKPDKVFPRAAPLDIGTNPLLLGLLLEPEPVGTGPVTSGDTGRKGVPWFVWAGVGAVAAGGATTAAVVLSSGDGGTGGDKGTIIVGPMP